MLFTLAHFHVFHPRIATHFTFVFPLLMNDMHVIGHTLDVVIVFLQS
jgi:hypothetical protein